MTPFSLESILYSSFLVSTALAVGIYHEELALKADALIKKARAFKLPTRQPSKQEQWRTDIAETLRALGRTDEKMVGYVNAQNKVLSDKIDRLAAQLPKPKSDDDKFVEQAERSNEISRVATHAARKTMEAGLNKIVPELVAAEVEKQMEGIARTISTVTEARIVSKYVMSKRNKPRPVEMTAEEMGLDPKDFEGGTFYPAGTAPKG